ncbi:hypothetical protein A3K34_03165 [candidate division WWE3 bacterium RIFOXYC1_FULL_40_10]|uniref:SCP domain-containing protein n=1 Tax=candidate division WWE3 bacterium RIFOXYA2_FULL_46_9 TaxID=1802636 RepID=A0A1F4VZI3_UNCKA|nr:MAG: hypothetical protein A3K58_03165 [candidate division WWE3 bacterium RIFOXYB1_FULL_40_22]OGC61848.1 MAG: hypothetical protein A3K37_03165 [candidate division WWE3 bacterium RIFOXYA1_FULL_40_11]OGC62213.1 MAG: hypothetical protein A2264_02920 [candidate division WWE3 bacterium RIFOXYA2_FULL_46_9]OGC64320.1 MAG: hypothetical protein A2326_00580 [candidate division WWE3 bacterium RIFOXYB2_FULL_41_6]OGC66231.1 MAG: hypothetical protein A3K34_03165 [candidate division WWE3 bacterium RIFOXYC1_
MIALVKNWRNQSKAIDKYQFLPHPIENKRATLLSNKAFAVYCILILLIAFLFRILPVFIPGVLGYASDISIRDLLESTNSTRAKSGQKALVLSATLSAAAEKKAHHMFEKSYWAHISPDGVEPWAFILAEGYDYVYAGENLAKNFSQSGDVVSAWYNSPSHRSNLLSPNYDEIGFAVVNGVLDGYETTLVVQMFGRPRNPARIAKIDDQEGLLSKLDNSTQVAPSVQSENDIQQVVVPEPVPASNLLIDLPSAIRTLGTFLGAFITALLVLDIWYSRRKGILKFNGHSVFHLTLFVAVLISIWFIISPGIVL